MEHKLENETLTIYFVGELNSFNSEEVEREVDSLVKKNKFNAIVIDMEKLNYISSAGIRIIVRLKQQFDDISIVKVPKDIFDIFEMVGLQNMFKIEKL